MQLCPSSPPSTLGSVACSGGIHQLLATDLAGCGRPLEWLSAKNMGTQAQRRTTPHSLDLFILVPHATTTVPSKFVL